MFSFERFSEEYRKFSEIMETDYNGYGLGADERTLVAKTARTVNLKELKKVLLSKDMSLYEENKWMFEGGAKFLDGEDINGSKIGMVTYPRTGNTFLRKLLQEITGIATGSDQHADIVYSFQMNGLKGEGIVDDRVWIKKSHFPLPFNGIGEFPVNKII
jgi:hypothetical protein